jgi:hypothetical protein
VERSPIGHLKEKLGVGQGAVEAHLQGSRPQRLDPNCGKVAGFPRMIVQRSFDVRKLDHIRERDGRIQGPLYGGDKMLRKDRVAV